MDGSVVGRGCIALMLHVVYKGRALPLVWRVRQSPKGHFPADLHIALVELVSGLVPEGAQVVFLGDGEFDGTRLQQTVQDAGWSYVCRTGCHMTASWDGETFRLDTLGSCIKPGTLVELSDMVRLCSSVAGQRDIKGRFIWSPIWLQQRRRVACIPNDFGSRHFSRIRRVVVSICINRICPIHNASLAC